MSNPFKNEFDVHNILRFNSGLVMDESVRLRFDRFPNGFLIAEDTDANSFFRENVTDRSKRDLLSVLLANTNLIGKPGVKSLQLNLPNVSIHNHEKIKAMKFINESILIWTDSFVYKIPASEKALNRANKVKDKVEILKGMEQDFQNLFLIPEFLPDTDSVQYTLLCKPIEFTKEQRSIIDRFLSTYFRCFLYKKPYNTVVNGFQHGDLHYRNIFLDNDNNPRITDLDMIHPEGYPFIDLIHFCVHFIRTKEKLQQYEPFETFLNDNSYLLNKLLEYKLPKLADLWIHYYCDEYIPLYVESQLAWYADNKITGDELIKIKEIRKRIEG